MSFRALLIWMFATAPVVAGGGHVPETANYRVTFDATWSATSHPSMFPAGAHFSPPVLATHSGGVRFWEDGQLASIGIEIMAETGGTGPLSNEIDAAITAGTAGQRVIASGLNSPGQTTADFTASMTHSLVTLVSMVAPSPDWYVGIDSVNMLVSGSWADRMVVELHGWDAGTDSGSTYLSANQDTQPQEPIALITSGPLGNGTRLGTLTFVRTDANPAWVDLGKGLTGSTTSILAGTGTLLGGSRAALTLRNALPNSFTLLVIGSSAINAPFAGGTLVPSIDFYIPGVADASGSHQVTGNWPAALGTGTQVFFQLWSVDPAGPKGRAASNALCATTQ